LFYFMVAPGVMKPQYGNTVFIDCVGINFAIVIFPGYAFSPSRHAYTGAIEIPVIIFERGAITSAGFFLAISVGIISIHSFDAPAKTVAGHTHAAPILDMIT